MTIDQSNKITYFAVSYLTTIIVVKSLIIFYISHICCLTISFSSFLRYKKDRISFVMINLEAKGDNTIN